MNFENQSPMITPTLQISLHLYSKIMLFSGANPTQALSMFSSMARCFDNAFTTGVPGGTCYRQPNLIIS